MPGFEVIGLEEQKEISNVFENGGILFRQGFNEERNGCFKVKEFEKKFSEFLKVPRSLAVTSGTAALRVALASLGIGRGDEVITQSFTFVATVEAIVESGATPLCANINDTLNIDPNSIEQLITKKTKAVIIVHMLGVPCEIESIQRICKKYGLFLIEDTAWGCGGYYKKKSLGTWGDVGTFSFDFAKTMTTGEGGMVVFKDSNLYKKAAAWHDHGHENNPSFPRWEDTRSCSGFNYRMMELQGAVGLAQLRKLEYIVKKQRENSDKIWEQIKDIPFIIRRREPSDSYCTSDSLIFQLESRDKAVKIRNNLLKNGISTKILPEAISWHFAGMWEHIPQLIDAHNGNIKKFLKPSEEKLNRSVSLPIKVNLDDTLLMKIRSSILEY
tara:strand:- start:80 stop:1234 length:1155 start_codon:yes stop_codon:yes gene_type:complete